jgi:hypothetical protein
MSPHKRLTLLQHDAELSTKRTVHDSRIESFLLPFDIYFQPGVIKMVYAARHLCVVGILRFCRHFTEWYTYWKAMRTFFTADLFNLYISSLQ